MLGPETRGFGYCSSPWCRLHRSYEVRRTLGIASHWLAVFRRYFGRQDTKNHGSECHTRSAEGTHTYLPVIFLSGCTWKGTGTRCEWESGCTLRQVLIDSTSYFVHTSVVQFSHAQVVSASPDPLFPSIGRIILTVSNVYQVRSINEYKFSLACAVTTWFSLARPDLENMSDGPSYHTQRGVFEFSSVQVRSISYAGPQLPK